MWTAYVTARSREELASAVGHCFRRMGRPLEPVQIVVGAPLESTTGSWLPFVIYVADEPSWDEEWGSLSVPLSEQLPGELWAFTGAHNTNDLDACVTCAGVALVDAPCAEHEGPARLDRAPFRVEAVVRWAEFGLRGAEPRGDVVAPKAPEELVQVDPWIDWREDPDAVAPRAREALEAGQLSALQCAESLALFAVSRDEQEEALTLAERSGDEAARLVVALALSLDQPERARSFLGAPGVPDAQRWSVMEALGIDDHRVERIEADLKRMKEYNALVRSLEPGYYGKDARERLESPGFSLLFRADSAIEDKVAGRQPDPALIEELRGFSQTPLKKRRAALESKDRLQLLKRRLALLPRGDESRRAEARADLALHLVELGHADAGDQLEAAFLSLGHDSPKTERVKAALIELGRF